MPRGIPNVKPLPEAAIEPLSRMLCSLKTAYRDRGEPTIQFMAAGCILDITEQDIVINRDQQWRFKTPPEIWLAAYAASDAKPLARAAIADFMAVVESNEADDAK